MRETWYGWTAYSHVVEAHSHGALARGVDRAHIPYRKRPGRRWDTGVGIRARLDTYISVQDMRRTLVTRTLVTRTSVYRI
jgi:hypothetical protein